MLDAALERWFDDLDARPGRPLTGPARTRLRSDVIAAARLVPNAMRRADAEAVLRANGYGPTTRHRIAESWVRFTAWHDGAASDDDGDGDRLDTVRVLSSMQLVEVACAALTPPAAARSAWPSRDLALFGLVGVAGTRPAEALSAVPQRRSDDHTTIVVRWHRLDRRVELSDLVSEALDRYVRERRSKSQSATPLFLRVNGSPLPVVQVAAVLSSMCRRAGLAHQRPTRDLAMVRRTWLLDRARSLDDAELLATELGCTTAVAERQLRAAHGAVDLGSPEAALRTALR